MERRIAVAKRARRRQKNIHRHHYTKICALVPSFVPRSTSILTSSITMVTALENASLAAQAFTSPVEELRHYGAMLDVHRRFGHRHEMLLVTDLSKAEASAGVGTRFTRAGKESWSVFAGGRDLTHETPTDTLDREIGEEILEI